MKYCMKITQYCHTVSYEDTVYCTVEFYINSVVGQQQIYVNVKLFLK